MFPANGTLSKAPGASNLLNKDLATSFSGEIILMSIIIKFCKFVYIVPGNISKTADFIGMERSALHRKLKSLGIKPSYNFPITLTWYLLNNLNFYC